MKDFSSKARVGQDSTPATHGDLEVWGGRLMEVIEEKADEIKNELRAEIKQSAEDVKTELRAEIAPLTVKVSDIQKEVGNLHKEVGNLHKEVINIKDQQYDMMLTLKSIEKKVSKK